MSGSAVETLGELGACLVLATAQTAAPGVNATAQEVFMPGERFTLAWTHSIEKVRWEEDYRIVVPKVHGSSERPQLLIEAARIRGTGAGMEPPADAVLKDGWYHYHPKTPSPYEQRLTRSPYTADYEWCSADKQCQPMGELLLSDGGITLLRPCRAPRPAAPRR
ncbi:DUF1850 domain-containing protein [Hydrogenophaga sp. 5NK40-0174]|uniref:DUF1850 domain-containing protein n=1 Tax=Hydrogenophaga sp. 5NK40-0174 TaxID=3127649 RepID=UPI003103BE97